MSNREILYIEDNFHNRRIVRKILERQGYMLHEREDGLEGYEFLKELKPGIVLLDISLPTMDGMEIARRVKEDLEVQHIYLIALTASAMQGDRERFLEAGCDDYLSKPFRALDLVDLVDKYADLVEANVPAPPPQPSELHDTKPLEREQKRISVGRSIPAPEERGKPAAEVPSDVEAVQISAPEDEVVAVLAPTVEEVAPTVDVEEDSVPIDVEEADKHEAEAPAAAEMEHESEEVEPPGGPNGKIEAGVSAEAVGAAPEQEEVDPKTEIVEEALSVVVENDEEYVSDKIETESKSEETETAWKPEKEVVDFKQVENETQDLQAAVEPLEPEEPSAETEAEQTLPSAPGGADLPKKNGNQSRPKQKNTEEIDAIKAGIMGVINPDNLKPVDPNNHRE